MTSSGRPTLNYTTTIEATKTVAEMQRMLGEHGAEAVVVNYRDRQPVGLSFRLETPHGMRAYALPVHSDQVLATLRDQARRRVGELAKPSVARRACTPEQAHRVAWRVLRDWLTVQLAFIQTRMVTVDQVMLPYLIVDGVTLYDRYVEHEQSLLAVTDGPSTQPRSTS